MVQTGDNWLIDIHTLLFTMDNELMCLLRDVLPQFAYLLGVLLMLIKWHVLLGKTFPKIE